MGTGPEEQKGLDHPPLTDNHLSNSKMLIDEVAFGLLKRKRELEEELAEVQAQVNTLTLARREIERHLEPRRLNMRQMVEESIMAGIQRSRPQSSVSEKLDRAVEYAVRLADKLKFPHKDPEFWRPHLEIKLAELMSVQGPTEDPGPPCVLPLTPED